MDKTDRLRDYGLAFLLYEHGLGVCGYELIRELFIFIKLILNSYLGNFNLLNALVVVLRGAKVYFLNLPYKFNQRNMCFFNIKYNINKPTNKKLNN